MTEQRVSDERLAVALHPQELAIAPTWSNAMISCDELALDLRDERARHAKDMAESRATILRLQARLDSVRPVVKAAVAYADQRGKPDMRRVGSPSATLITAVDALPADDRAWAKETDGPVVAGRILKVFGVRLDHGPDPGTTRVSMDGFAGERILPYSLDYMAKAVPDAKDGIGGPLDPWAAKALRDAVAELHVAAHKKEADRG